MPPVPSFWGPGSQSNRPHLLGLVIILLAALVAITPELLRGPSCGHDFDFHLVSWFDALNGWRHGLLYPHWTPSANYGAGEPRFVFYSPLTWMMAAALATVLPWTAVPIALTYLLLAGTGLATRALARQALNEAAATLAGCIALFSGYALFTAYERTAFAELAGGFWLPLVLLYALRARHASAPPKRILDTSIVPLALAIAGSWLSNPTVGVMACYTLAAIAVTLILLERSWLPALRAAAGAVLGLCLIAIYLVPAAWEQRWVDIHQVTSDPGQTLENNWLFALHADPSLQLHDQVLHTASMIVVVMIALTLAAILIAALRRRLPCPSRWWIALALIPITVLFLQFPFSRWLWNLLPDLRFLQFPWRWLVVLEAPMGIFIASAIWPAHSTRKVPRLAVSAAFTVIFLALTVYSAQTLFQPCDEEDAVSPMLNTYRSGQGFIGTSEYEPIGADISEIATGLPSACLVDDPTTELGKPATDPDSPPTWDASQRTCEATFSATNSPEHWRLTATLPRAGFLVLRLRSYPAWRIALNGQSLASLPFREDGLIAVPVPRGPVNLTVDWTTTTDVLVSRWLSLLAVLILTILCVVRLRSSRARLSSKQ